METRSLCAEIIINVVDNYVATNPDLKEWLSFRLISRTFNHQLLVAYFVHRVQNVRDIGPVCRDERNWKNLLTSWQLQGALAQPLSCDQNHLEWLDNINQASKRLKACINIFPLNLANTLMSYSISAICLGYTEVVCNALVRLLSADVISKRLSDPSTKFEGIEDTVSNILYVATCFIGEVKAVQYALDTSETVPSETVPSETVTLGEEQLAFINNGLLVAAMQGNQDVVKHVLDNGFNVNISSKYGCTITSAIESGSHSFIEFLLRPENRLKKSGTTYNDAISGAAGHSDPVARLMMVKELFAHAEIVESDARLDVLCKASEVNDLDLAEFVLNNGPINFDETSNRHNGLTHPLLRAIENGYLELVRLMLKTPFKFNKQWSFDYFNRKALEYAQQSNSLPIFTTIVAYQKLIYPDEVRALEEASEVEGGVEAVEEILGPYNFEVKTKEGEDQSLGAIMLRAAVLALKPQNVRWLLSRGVRTKNKIMVYGFQYSGQYKCFPGCIEDYQEMDLILKEYQNPGINFLS